MRLRSTGRRLGSALAILFSCVCQVQAAVDSAAVIVSSHLASIRDSLSAGKIYQEATHVVVYQAHGDWDDVLRSLETESADTHGLKNVDKKLELQFFYACDNAAKSFVYMQRGGGAGDYILWQTPYSRVHLDAMDGSALFQAAPSLSNSIPKGQFFVGTAWTDMVIGDDYLRFIPHSVFPVWHGLGFEADCGIETISALSVRNNLEDHLSDQALTNVVEMDVVPLENGQVLWESVTNMVRAVLRDKTTVLMGFDALGRCIRVHSHNDQARRKTVLLWRYGDGLHLRRGTILLSESDRLNILEVAPMEYTQGQKAWEAAGGPPLQFDPSMASRISDADTGMTIEP